MSKLVLFDLDGTMLSTQGAGMRAMARAGAGLFGDGFHFDGIVSAGGLDPLLFAAAAGRCGVELNDANHASFAEAYHRLLAEELAAGVRILPGVIELLDEMHRHAGITLGILTGNYARTTPVKLRAAGIDPDIFAVGAFGDDANTRPGMVPVALARYEKLHARPVLPNDVMLIGDTPKDIDAAKSNNCLAVGVATGPYSTAELLDAGADLALPDLADPTAIWELLGMSNPHQH
ncbi:MAG: HAD hydrolase-like protein [Planctomycetes bacterium]|nr:HAD hydrolase-like protein [Planctomycetota bacterium]